MKRILKWVAIVLVVVAGGGFVAFLYFIPPLDRMPADTFIKGELAGVPSLDGIADPAERALAERGKYIIVSNTCTGCHMTAGEQGPDPTMYLAGGMKFVSNTSGTVVARNLTPDRETGLGTRTDEEIIRVLRSGVLSNGRSASHRVMPWSAFSNWTDEDLHAIVAYLRHLKPIRHAIPNPEPGTAEAIEPGAVEVGYGADYGKK